MESCWTLLLCHANVTFGEDFLSCCEVMKEEKTSGCTGTFCRVVVSTFPVNKQDAFSADTEWRSSFPHANLSRLQ